jgi:hypothetical protein
MNWQDHICSKNKYNCPTSASTGHAVVSPNRSFKVCGMNSKKVNKKGNANG